MVTFGDLSVPRSLLATPRSWSEPRNNPSPVQETCQPTTVAANNDSQDTLPLPGPITVNQDGPGVCANVCGDGDTLKIDSDMATVPADIDTAEATLQMPSTCIDTVGLQPKQDCNNTAPQPDSVTKASAVAQSHDQLSGPASQKSSVTNQGCSSKVVVLEIHYRSVQIDG